MCFGNETFECKIIKERLSRFLANSSNVYIDKSSYILNCLWSFFDLIFKFLLMRSILILGYWTIVFLYTWLILRANVVFRSALVSAMFLVVLRFPFSLFSRTFSSNLTCVTAPSNSAFTTDPLYMDIDHQRVNSHLTFRYAEDPIVTEVSRLNSFVRWDRTERSGN